VLQKILTFFTYNVGVAHGISDIRNLVCGRFISFEKGG